MDGGKLADSIMTFTEERPPNPTAFRQAAAAEAAEAAAAASLYGPGWAVLRAVAAKRGARPPTALPSAALCHAAHPSAALRPALRPAAHPAACPPPRVLPCREDMARLFEGLDPELMRTNTPEVISQMMDTVRQHQVHLRGVVSTVVVSSRAAGFCAAQCWGYAAASCREVRCLPRPPRSLQ